jgi:ABC-2 type transport system ATP-binding protein
VIAVSRLRRTFGDRVAVDDVSFELVPGEVFGLLGPNGGGKTTTLRMVAGLIRPSSGEVRIDGVPVTSETSARLRARIGFLTEAPGLWDQFSVRQTLLVYARLHGLDAPERAVDASLELFGLGDRAAEHTVKLSKGLKQRVALARALLHNPSVLLLDEPTAGLDPESARGVRDLILRLRHDRRAVVVSTHNLDEVDRIADRVAVIKSRLLALDTPAALRRRLFGQRLRIVLAEPAEPVLAKLLAVTNANGALTAAERVLVADLARLPMSVPDLVRRLVEAGAAIEAIVPEDRPLEDAYLELVGVRPGSDGGQTGVRPRREA